MDEIIYEKLPTNHEDINNDLVQIEKEIKVLEQEEYKLAAPLMRVRYEIAQRKRDLSIATKEYWRAKR